MSTKADEELAEEMCKAANTPDKWKNPYRFGIMAGLIEGRRQAVDALRNMNLDDRVFMFEDHFHLGAADWLSKHFIEGGDE